MKNNQENFLKSSQTTIKKMTKNSYQINKDQDYLRERNPQNMKDIYPMKNLKNGNDKGLSVITESNEENMKIPKRNTETIRNSYLRKNDNGKKFKTTNFKKSNNRIKPSIEKFKTNVKEVFSENEKKLNSYVKDIIFDISSQLNAKGEIMNLANDGEIILKKSKRNSKPYSPKDLHVDPIIISKKYSADHHNEDPIQENPIHYNESKPYSIIKKIIRKNTSASQLSNQDNNQQSILLIHHESMTRIIWDIIIYVIVIYTIVVTPIYLCFYKDTLIFIVFECFIEIIFLNDLLLNFITTYNDNEENLVTKISHISEQYLSSWFIYDLISSIPIEIISLFININIPFTNHHYSLGYEVFKWIKVLQVVKIFRENSSAILLRHIVLNQNDKLNRIFKFGLLFFFLSHICSCFFIYVGFSCTTQHNWIVQYGLGISNFDIYVTSLYFNLVTIYSIGYGDITPVNLVEKCWVIIFMFVGSMLYSYAISSISTIFLEKNIKYGEFKRKMSVLESIDSEYDIPSSLLRKLTKTIKYQYNKNENERYEFLDSLPTKLKNDLMIILYEEIIAQQSFFKKQPHDFLLYVLPMLRFHRVEKGETLISVGDIVEEMYFVIKGCLSLTLGVHSNNLQVCKVKKGNHFGDLLMQLNENSPFELKCKMKSTDVLVLKKEDFLKIKNSFTNNIFEILENSLNQLKFVDKNFQLFHLLLNNYNDPKLVKRKMIQLNNYLFEKGLDDYLEDQIEFEEPLEFIKSNGVNQVIEIIESYDKSNKVDLYKLKPTRIKNTEEKFLINLTKMNMYDETKNLGYQEILAKDNSEILNYKEDEEKELKSINRSKIRQKFSSKKGIRESFKTVLNQINKTIDVFGNKINIKKDQELKLKSSNLFEITEFRRKDKPSRTIKDSGSGSLIKIKTEEIRLRRDNQSITLNKKDVYSKKNILKALKNFPSLSVEKSIDFSIYSQKNYQSKINNFLDLKQVLNESFCYVNKRILISHPHSKKTKLSKKKDQEINKEILDEIDKNKDQLRVKNKEILGNQFYFLNFNRKEGEIYINEVMNRLEINMEKEIICKLENIFNKVNKYQTHNEDCKVYIENKSDQICEK